MFCNIQNPLPYLLFAIIFLYGCNQATTEKNEANKLVEKNFDMEKYIPTTLPFNMNGLTKGQLAYIAESHKTDTSAYLIDTRPIIFEITGVANSVTNILETATFNKSVDVLIYCLGEIKKGKLLDYGWIENASGQKIWEMNTANSTYAGGDERNIKSIFQLHLPKGMYTLHYQSNEEHAFNNWIGESPENPGSYGITVFNLAVTKRLNEYFREQHVIDRNSFEL
jgi:hypothetical protein